MRLDVEHIPVFPVACISPSQSLLLIASTALNMQPTKLAERHFTLAALKSSSAFTIQPNIFHAQTPKRRAYRNPKATFGRVWEAKDMSKISFVPPPVSSTVVEVLSTALTSQPLEEFDPFLTPTPTANILPTSSAISTEPATETAEEFDPFLEQAIAATVLPETATEPAGESITVSSMSLPIFQDTPAETIAENTADPAIKIATTPEIMVAEAAEALTTDQPPEASFETPIQTSSMEPMIERPSTQTMLASPEIDRAPGAISLPMFQDLPAETSATELAAPASITIPEAIDEADPISTIATPETIALTLAPPSLEAFAETETVVLKPYPTPNLSLFGDHDTHTPKEFVSEAIPTFGSNLAPPISSPVLELPIPVAELAPTSNQLAVSSEDGAEAIKTDQMPDKMVDAAVDSAASLAAPSNDFSTDSPSPPVLKPKPPMDLEASSPEPVVAPNPPKEKLITTSAQFSESKYPEGISADEVGKLLKELGTDPATVLDHADCLKIDGDLTARQHLTYAVLQLPEEKWRIVADNLPTKSLGVLVETGYGLLIARHNKSLQQVVIDLEHVHHDRVGQAFNSAIAFSKEEAPVLVSMQEKPKTGLKRFLGL